MGSDARRNPLSFESHTRKAILLDRFGREISVGDLVVMSAINFDPPIFKVAEITPNLAPNAPANTLRVVFEAQIGSFMIAEQPQQDLLVVAKPPVKESPDAAEARSPNSDN